MADFPIRQGTNFSSRRHKQFPVTETVGTFQIVAGRRSCLPSIQRNHLCWNPLVILWDTFKLVQLCKSLVIYLRGCSDTCCRKSCVVLRSNLSTSKTSPVTCDEFVPVPGGFLMKGTLQGPATTSWKSSTVFASHKNLLENPTDVLN